MSHTYEPGWDVIVRVKRSTSREEKISVNFDHQHQAFKFKRLVEDALRETSARLKWSGEEVEIEVEGVGL